jgi:galactokinase
MRADPEHRAVADFVHAFGRRPEKLFRAPGRVNLIGEHTDYNDGFVLPCAIERSTFVAAAGADDGLISVSSADFGETDDFDPSYPFAKSGKGWANYVRAVAAALPVAGGTGARLAIAGDVPLGAGLSSSASLDVALAMTFASLAGLTLASAEIARAAQRAENDFVGCPCGIMDPLVAARAEAGHALLIDCRSLDCRPIPLPADHAIFVVHSGIRHSNNDGAYEMRRRQCEAAARHFGVVALRDLALERLESEGNGLDPILLRRARHVLTENARVLACANALSTGDLAGVGRLMRESHRSMRDDFEITIPPIDALAGIMDDVLAERGGARMTGGGFGGCVVALCPNDLVDALQKRVREEYRGPDGNPPAIFLFRAADAAGEVALPAP